MDDVVIIGGGLAGLINAILLSRNGLQVRLLEKKAYPQHRVCGEYISNEVLPFLERHQLFPKEYEPAQITKFHLTSIKGRLAQLPLDLGAFAISRYRFDQFLYEKATSAGVDVQLNTTASDIVFQDNHFSVSTRKGASFESKIVIGAFGKRSLLDRQMNRAFFRKKSPYIGVKYHIKTDYPKDVTALHNFRDGYCGINKIEGAAYNLCYLSHRKNLEQHGSIDAMEKEVLQQNPHLQQLFQHSDFLFDRPEVINEISFEKKAAVEQHVLMSGDSAGMITPLCGNGMAMAIHAAKLSSEAIIAHWNNGNFDRSALEADYTQQWNRLFATRLWAGRQIQSLFGGAMISEIAVGLVKNIRPVAQYLMKQTHGKPF